MSINALPMKLGTVSTAGVLAGLLGQSFRVDDPDAPLGARVFVLVRASANITAPSRKAVVSALDGTSGQPTWLVAATTTANSTTVLVIPTDYGSTTIASGEYFLAQAKGIAEVISAAAIAAGAVIGTSTTSGSCDDLSISGGGIIGYALEAAAGAAENVACVLSGASVGV
jgi:hypothetical protein